MQYMMINPYGIKPKRFSHSGYIKYIVRVI